MGSVWLGLVGAIIGGLVSLIGTLITFRLQWRQEIARWSEERERNVIQWERQIESDARKWESERRRDELSGERSRQDEKLRWLREQRLKYYLETLDQFQAASELSRHVEFPEGKEYVGPESVKEIYRELRIGHRSLNSLRAVCGDDLAEYVIKLNDQLYYTILHLENKGMGPGHMVKRLDGKEWILSGTIDGWSEELAESLRTDLGLN